MNIPKIISKATIISAFIFWLIIFSFETQFEGVMIFYILLAFIPISILCAIVIGLTILPFFWFNGNDSNNEIVFKRYFPFYAMVSFSLCVYGSIIEPFMICFYVSAFFTTMQSWLWLGKEKR